MSINAFVKHNDPTSMTVILNRDDKNGGQLFENVQAPVVTSLPEDTLYVGRQVKHSKTVSAAGITIKFVLWETLHP